MLVKGKRFCELEVQAFSFSIISAPRKADRLLTFWLVNEARDFSCYSLTWHCNVCNFFVPLNSNKQMKFHSIRSLNTLHILQICCDKILSKLQVNRKLKLPHFSASRKTPASLYCPWAEAKQLKKVSIFPHRMPCRITEIKYYEVK